MSSSEHVSNERNDPWIDGLDRSDCPKVGSLDDHENPEQIGDTDGQICEMSAPASPTGDATSQDLLLSYDDEYDPMIGPRLSQEGGYEENRRIELVPSEQCGHERKDSAIQMYIASPSTSPIADIAARDFLLPNNNEHNGHATSNGVIAGPQEELCFGPMAPSQPDLQPLWNIREVMSPEGDASSEEANSLNGSDKAIYHGPQHEEALIEFDSAYSLDNLLQQSDLNGSYVFQRGTDRMKSHDDTDAGLAGYKTVRQESPLRLLVPIPEHASGNHRCVTPQKSWIPSHHNPTSERSPASPTSPKSPISQASRSETYLHTFETDRFTARSPAPPFVVVPHGTESARVTVTTIGLVRSGDEDEISLTNQVYLRKGFVFTLVAILLLGVLTMVSGLLSSYNSEETQPNMPYEPIVDRPAPAPYPATPRPSTAFYTVEPVFTPRPGISFPVDSPTNPGFFPPVDGKIVREETLHPTVSPSPTVLRTRPQVPETSDPTFPPTAA
jgi:hypothetical protein